MFGFFLMTVFWERIYLSLSSFCILLIFVGISFHELNEKHRFKIRHFMDNEHFKEHYLNSTTQSTEIDWCSTIINRCNGSIVQTVQHFLLHRFSQYWYQVSYFYQCKQILLLETELLTWNIWKLCLYWNTLNGPKDKLDTRGTINFVCQLKQRPYFIEVRCLWTYTESPKCLLCNHRVITTPYREFWS